MLLASWIMPVIYILPLMFGADFVGDVAGGVVSDLWQQSIENSVESFKKSQKIRLTNKPSSEGLIILPSGKSYEVRQFMSCDLKTKETFKDLTIEFKFEIGTEIIEEGISYTPKTTNKLGYEVKNKGNENIRTFTLAKELSSAETGIISLTTSRTVDELTKEKTAMQKPLIKIMGKNLNGESFSKTLENCE